jgi:hypothetical protein
MTARFRSLALTSAAFCALALPPKLVLGQLSQEMTDQFASANCRNYERVTAHLRGVYGPRGYFNLVVGLHSYPLAGLFGAQFNIKPGLMVLDIAPGFPRVTVAEIHHIEAISGYSPGLVEIQEIPPEELAEAGPGWRKIQPPRSRSAILRWFERNFINHHT